MKFFWVLLFVLVSNVARASGTDHDFWQFLSGTGNIVYLTAGIGLPLIEDGKDGKNHAARGLDAAIVSTLFSEGLKGLVQEQRPDKSDHESFPSGHATAVFAIATVESAYHPKQAPYWFAGAALIASSRVGLHVHYVHDVLFGAALGYGVARWELSARHGLLLTPFITPDSKGVQMRATF